MFALQLPDFSSSAHPEFQDPRSCKDWLRLLPLINVRQSQIELTEAIGQINAYAGVSALDRLKIMEMLRDPAHMVQEEASKKYLGKPLPLSNIENESWKATLQLWQTFRQGYERCLAACLAQDAQVQSYRPLIHQRCLIYMGFEIREYLLAYRQIPNELWQRLHGLYALAEKAGYQQQLVKDSLNHMLQNTHCLAAYMRPLLLNATNSNSMPTKQLLWVDRLLEKWSINVELQTQPVVDFPFCQWVIDLSEGKPLQTGTALNQSSQTRFLDTTKLGSSLRKRLKLLRQGEQPNQMGLGEEYSLEACLTAMQYLYQQWCDAGAERAYQRRSGQGTVQVASQINNIHYLMTGHIMDLTNQPTEYSVKQVEELQVYGHVVNHQDERLLAEKLGYGQEPWQIQDESATGFRLYREQNGHARLQHQQLLAIQTQESGPYLIGVIRWLMEDGEQKMTVGLRLLPGRAQPIAVRAVGLSPNGHLRFIPAIWLAGVSTLKTNDTLVTPSGWFKPGRVIELQTKSQTRRFKIASLLERGADFERMTLEAMHANLESATQLG